MNDLPLHEVLQVSYSTFYHGHSDLLCLPVCRIGCAHSVTCCFHWRQRWVWWVLPKTKQNKNTQLNKLANSWFNYFIFIPFCMRYKFAGAKIAQELDRIYKSPKAYLDLPISFSTSSLFVSLSSSVFYSTRTKISFWIFMDF